MSDTKDGGAAFPLHPGVAPDWTASAGMTLRDWFAGQALAGFIASGTFSNAGTGFESFIAGHAYNVADAMLEARKGETK